MKKFLTTILLTLIASNICTFSGIGFARLDADYDKVTAVCPATKALEDQLKNLTLSYEELKEKYDILEDKIKALSNENKNTKTVLHELIRIVKDAINIHLKAVESIEDEREAFAKRLEDKITAKNR
ncbi:MAG: hypothetical protein IJ758_01590 [Clostridia bacterium]|nr:hypothetical protein [Clostridia bacterium]